MEIFSLTGEQPQYSRVVLALGNFDGVHRGHQALLNTAVEQARENALAPAVWTFSELAKEDGRIPALVTQEEKFALMAQAGIALAFTEHFSDVRDWSAQTFAEYLARQVGAAAVVCGFNFRFGRGGIATAEDLQTLMKQYDVGVTVVPPVPDGGEPISSTRIRAAVENGDMETAARLLGRPFSVSLPIVHGNKLGRTIGFPTANMDFPRGLIHPRRGVYITQCAHGGREYTGITNIGVRPSVESDGHVNCETHLLDFSGDLYGQTVRVSFARYLREEQKFPSLDGLQAQLYRDIAQARAYAHTQSKGGEVL